MTSQIRRWSRLRSAGCADVTTSIIWVQPLSSGTAKGEKKNTGPVAATAAQPAPQVIEKVVYRPVRRKLPDERASITHKFTIGGHEGYITVGMYEDGTPGEIF